MLFGFSDIFSVINRGFIFNRVGRKRLAFIFLFLFQFSHAHADQYLSSVRDNYRSFGNHSLIYLIEKNPELIENRIHDGRTLLQTTAMLGDLDAIKFLLELGANPNLGNPKPIEAALIRLTVGYGYEGEPGREMFLSDIEILKSIKVLLDYGAELNFQPEPRPLIYKTFFEFFVDEICGNDVFKDEFLPLIYDMKINIVEEDLGPFFIHIMNFLGEGIINYDQECVIAFVHKIGQS